MPRRVRPRNALLVSGAALLLALALAPLFGSTAIWPAALDPASPARLILTSVRLPRVALAALGGAALALSGALLQALLRNTLACPYTLGISGGAALGAASVILLGWADRFAQFPVVTLAALAGAALTTSFVAALAAHGGLSPQSLLLAGVSLNSLCFAAMLLVQHAAGLAQSFAIGRWLLGGIDPVSSTVLLTLAVTLGAAVLLACRSAARWNQLALGDEWAAARGVDTGRLRLQGLAIASLLAALVTSFTGPIGFVGLLVPNAVRLLLGPDHRLLLPVSALWGAVLLLGCDTLGRILAPPGEIPAGILTALAGAPFLVFLLGSKAGQRS